MAPGGNNRSRTVDVKIRTCANCAHFEIVEEGYEIGKIEDLKYMKSRCRALGWEVKEHYAFESGAGAVREIRTPPQCPRWKRKD